MNKEDTINNKEKLNKKDTLNPKEEMREKKGIAGSITNPSFPIRVGILTNNFSNGIVRPDVPGAFEDIFIDRNQINGAPFGMKVVCEVISAPEDYEMRGRRYYFDEFSGRGMAKGRIVEVLGDPGSNDTAMMGILLSHHLKQDFPDPVMKLAKTIPLEIPEDEIQIEIQNGRIDRRKEQIITIDGADAKDLDDAVSIVKTPENHYLVGVHIADVTHYVKEGNAIDKNAVTRGTSVYLADRVIPMLPQSLSNGICSLHPGKPKFALSVIMELDESGEVLSSEFTESVIQSSARFTYDEVFRMLGDEKETIDHLEIFRPMLEMMRNAAVILRRRRFENGSIQFEFPETKVILDSEKKVLDVHAEPNTFANEMIEELMILCNETVAKKFALLKAPFIYRVHEQPDPEKVERFQKAAKLFGEKIPLSKSVKPHEMRDAVNKIQGKPYSDTLMQMMLRSMAKAKYSDLCLGHFGLSLTYYCHFTSPIRRYPDLFIHRVVKASIHGESFPKKWVKKASLYSESSSNTERNAMEAERESVDFKTAEYMERHVGDVFPGKITGMFHSGIFVQLENTIEGMAPFRTMRGYYEYDEESMTVRSETGNRIIRIGDRVNVKVVQADRIARRIEFSLDEKDLPVDQTGFRGRSKGKTDRKSRQAQENRKFAPAPNGKKKTKKKNKSNSTNNSTSKSTKKNRSKNKGNKK